MSEGVSGHPDWRSPGFREQIRTQIANAVQSLGSPPQAHPPAHMEEQMFNKSKTADEYLNYVQKLLTLLRERRQQSMVNQAGGPAVQGGPGQGPSPGPSQQRPDGGAGPIGPLQMLARQVGQPGTVPNQASMMNNPNPAQQNMAGGPGGAPQQQFPNAMAQGGGGPGGMMMVNTGGGGMMTTNQGQMMPGSAPGGPGGPVIPGGMAVGPPRGPITSTTATVSAQQQQQMLNQQQRMNQQRLAMQRALAAQQQQQQQQHQQQLQHAQQQNIPISQAGMANQTSMMTAGPPHPQNMQPRAPYHGGVQGSGGAAVMGGSSVGGVVSAGGNVVPMSAGNVPMNSMTVSPSPSGNQMSNNQMIRSPATYNPMLPSPNGGTNYQNVQSPASNNFQGPPSVGPPSVDRAYSAPSPGNPMSTPRQQPVSSPAAHPVNDLDFQCQQKLQELASTFMEPLKRWIHMKEAAYNSSNEGKMLSGEEDQKEQKELKKMRSLLDILSNKIPPGKVNVNLPLLQKCERVLQSILNQQQQSCLPKPPIVPPPSVPPKDQVLGQPLIDAVADSLKRPHGGASSGGRCASAPINHALFKTFGTALDSLLGPPASVPNPPLAKKLKMDEDETEARRKRVNVPWALQGELARLPRRFVVKRDPASDRASNDLRLLCTLDDVHLPAVPPIGVVVSRDYPDSSPAWDDDVSGRLNTTPFLREAKKNFGDRLVKMSDLHSLTSLLDTWEMSVRSTCSAMG